ncbi:hypothetical protein TNCV_2376531 [Trichonephila clavipes]|nr:hypothetical protein TNCV_2376531 [Trichonephila clavipes]
MTVGQVQACNHKPSLLNLSKVGSQKTVVQLHKQGHQEVKRRPCILRWLDRTRESGSMATMIARSHIVGFFFIRGNLKELVYRNGVATQTDLVNSLHAACTCPYLRFIFKASETSSLNNTMHVACRVLTYLDTEGIRLSSTFSRSTGGANPVWALGTFQLFETIKSICEVIRERPIAQCSFSQCSRHTRDEPEWNVSPAPPQLGKLREVVKARSPAVDWIKLIVRTKEKLRNGAAKCSLRKKMDASTNF